MKEHYWVVEKSGLTACLICGEYKNASAPKCSRTRDWEIGMDKKEDVVNHPSHYTMGSIEVIEAIEDWKLGFHEANVVKYVARARYKGSELEDLKKGRWYLTRRIEQLEEDSGANS